MKDSAADQRTHYDGFADEYSRHYDDEFSQEYRNRFIFDRLFKGAQIEKSLILDAMCGSGGVNLYLSGKQVRSLGLDISFRELLHYGKTNGSGKAVCASAFDICLPDRCVDGIVIMGGLHHLHPRVNDSFVEFHRILKDHGSIYFCEPHQGSLPDIFRRIWYRFDPLFLSNEASIDLKKLILENAGFFDFEILGYFGNLAYLLVLNSMVLRLGAKFKMKIAKPLFLIESLLSHIQNRFFSCFVLVKAEKIETLKNIA